MFISGFPHQSHDFDLHFRPWFFDLCVLVSNQTLYLLGIAIHLHCSYSQKLYLLENFEKTTFSSLTVVCALRENMCCYMNW